MGNRGKARLIRNLVLYSSLRTRATVAGVFQSTETFSSSSPELANTPKVHQVHNNSLSIGQRKGPVNDVGGHKKPFFDLGWYVSVLHSRSASISSRSQTRNPQKPPQRSRTLLNLPQHLLVAIQRRVEVRLLVPANTIPEVASLKLQSLLLLRIQPPTTRENVRRTHSSFFFSRSKFSSSRWQSRRWSWRW